MVFEVGPDKLETQLEILFTSLYTFRVSTASEENTNIILNYMYTCAQTVRRKVWWEDELQNTLNRDSLCSRYSH